jgi:phosphate/sulfate permease
VQAALTFSMTIFLIVLLTALVFEYINGFHDAANAIATVVSTKVLTPRQAIALAAVFNLIGALMGTAVASTIGKGLVDTNVVTMATIFSGLMGAIIWNLITWWFGLPSSSSHALIGGLCGAALASAGRQLERAALGHDRRQGRGRRPLAQGRAADDQLARSSASSAAPS